LPFATALFSLKTWNAPGEGLPSSRVSLRSRQITAISDFLVLLFWHGLRFSIKENPVDPKRNRYGQSRNKMFWTGHCTRILRGGRGWNGAGLLLAPKSGEQTRRSLKEYARRTEEEVLEKAKEARAALDQIIESGKHFIGEKTANVEEAVKAGRGTMNNAG